MTIGTLTWSWFYELNIVCQCGCTLLLLFSSGSSLLLME